MPSDAYYEWLNAGEPYEPCRPVKDFVELLRSKGYTVYHKGDTSHMQAVPPEDHTPFSATGWPVASKRWIGHALDIMPDGPIPLNLLASRIIADRIAGVNGAQWIKYINWTDAYGKTWHYAWEPQLVKTSSSDKGHIHISARSDMDTTDVVSWSGYDPVKGLVMATQFNAEDISTLRNAAMAVLQYSGRGIGENADDATGHPLPSNRSVLSYLNEILMTGRSIEKKIDDLTEKINALPMGGSNGTFPTVTEISTATVDEFKNRLTSL